MSCGACFREPRLTLPPMKQLRLLRAYGICGCLIELRQMGVSAISASEPPLGRTILRTEGLAAE